MNAQLLEIQPSNELKFIFELKKQCTCSVRLTNNTHHFVAFKVKTTSPKKYCVRPNVGVISPKSTRDFAVTMQAQREAPPDMICKDKFLIQSTVVSLGTTDEDITAATFAKGDGRLVEESKLKVTLVSPPSSPVLSPINRTFKQKPDFEDLTLKEPVFAKVRVTPLQKVTNVEEPLMLKSDDLEPTKDAEQKPKKDIVKGGAVKPIKTVEFKPVNTVIGGDLKPIKAAEMKLSEDMDSNEGLEPINGIELRPRKDLGDGEDLKLSKDAELQPRNVIDNSKDLKPPTEMEPKPMKDVNTEEIKLVNQTELNDLKGEGMKTREAAEDMKFVKDIEQMKLKLSDLESKLGEAEIMISQLSRERKLSIQERKMLQDELVTLRREKGGRHVQVGFPLLFVFMVALVSVVVGYLLHS